MDILRKEINSIYYSQALDRELLDAVEVEACKRLAEGYVSVNGACSVITDASCDRCYLFAGRLGALMGLTDAPQLYQEVDSSDEDIIYNRLHPEDLVEKRMLEYEYFKFVDALSPEEKLHYKATSRIRLMDRNGQYIMLDNSVQILRHSPAGKIWLIMCCYDLAPAQEAGIDINPRIVNNLTGEIITMSLSDRKERILTEREKEILLLIKEGKPSKQIADILGISVHTVSRHRQNIIEKLSVGNSVEAVMAATSMKLL